jgi:hypothetical protein
MKLKLLLTAFLALGGLAAGLAGAQSSENEPRENNGYNGYRCSLTASHYYVPIGQSYSYTVWTAYTQFSPLPPPTDRPITVVFYGSKNGVPDIGPGGETYPAFFPGNATVNLPGYFNTGNFTGTYFRYAVIHKNGVPVCVTNAVSMILQ